LVNRTDVRGVEVAESQKVRMQNCIRFIKSCESFDFVHFALSYPPTGKKKVQGPTLTGNLSGYLHRYNYPKSTPATHHRISSISPPGLFFCLGWRDRDLSSGSFSHLPISLCLALRLPRRTGLMEGQIL